MIVDSDVQNYLAKLTDSTDAVQREMEALAAQRGFPIVGPQVGRLLLILAKASGAKTVLELGSGFGYSAFWFAKGLPPEGRIHCTDFSPDNRRLAQGFFEKAGISEKITFQVGSALELAEDLEGPFDIIFCDIDKQDYPQTVERILPKLKTNGLFITDNVLWRGHVAHVGTADATTQAIARFNATIANHRQLDTVILPLRDGVSVCLKR